MTYDAIAAPVGLTRNGGFTICQRYEQRGRAGLKSGRKGPAPGQGRLLSAEQEREVRRLIRRHAPDALDLPFALWSRAAVQALILDRFGVRLAAHHRPLPEALGLHGAEAAAAGLRAGPGGGAAGGAGGRATGRARAGGGGGLGGDYPMIVAQAKAAGGVIFWADETGLRSDDVRG